VARRRAPALRLPRHQGHQRPDPGRGAAAQDGDGAARQGRAEEEAGGARASGPRRRRFAEGRR
jgi:hypothetical protein